MQNYLALNGTLHYIDPAFAHLLPAGCVPISEAEAEALRSPGSQPSPAEVRLAEIDEAAKLTPRAFRELVILVAEGFKMATGGALDLKAMVPGVAQVFTLEEEAAALREQLKG